MRASQVQWSPSLFFLIYVTGRRTKRECMTTTTVQTYIYIYIFRQVHNFRFCAMLHFLIKTTSMYKKIIFLHIDVIFTIFLIHLMCVHYNKLLFIIVRIKIDLRLKSQRELYRDKETRPHLRFFSYAKTRTFYFKILENKMFSFVQFLLRSENAI